MNLKTYANPDFNTEYWNKYFNTLFEYLKTCISKENSSGIKGIITLIIIILKEMDNPGEIFETSDEINIFNNGTDYTFVCPDRKFKQSLIVGSNEPVWSVRDKVCYYSDIPLNTFCFKHNKKFIDYNEDFKVFKDITHSSFIVEIFIRPNIISSLKVNPQSLLQQDKKLFKLVFDLLRNSHESSKFNLNYY